MTRAFCMAASVALVSTLVGCGGTVGGILDAFNESDMTTPADMTPGGPGCGDLVVAPAMTLFRLPEGVYKVMGAVTIISDGCLVNPNDPQNPTDGQIYALTNDGNGNIKLNN